MPITPISFRPHSLIHIQQNFVISKSSGLEVLFRIISSLIYREVDIKIFNPQKCIFISFLSSIRCGRVKKRLWRFFYAPLSYMWLVTQKGTSWVDDVISRKYVLKLTSRSRKNSTPNRVSKRSLTYYKTGSKALFMLRFSATRLSNVLYDIKCSLLNVCKLKLDRESSTQFSLWLDIFLIWFTWFRSTNLRAVAGNTSLIKIFLILCIQFVLCMDCQFMK